MTDIALAICAIVYLGMILGSLPLLQLDRTGIALLGAIALIGLDIVDIDSAAASIHRPTLILLFAFMVVSAQMRLGGFYEQVTRSVAAWRVGPRVWLAGLMAVVALLSAIFSNDVVCLAVAPVLVQACRLRRFAPVPALLGLACAANIGSAATLIGNPQNMLVGQTLNLSFDAYLRAAWPPVLGALVLTWAVLCVVCRRDLVQVEATRPPDDPAPAAVDQAGGVDATPLDRWQTAKGLVVSGAILAGFLWGPWPHDVVALTGAGVLLMSRRFRSSRMLGLVDWELLVLFIGLFIVNHALMATGAPQRIVDALAAAGVPLSHPLPFFLGSFVLSNVVSNVPAVMLLLPHAPATPWAGPTLALASTLAGNLLLVGSIANLIVADAAAREGIRLDWRAHARVGVPSTLLSLALTGAYLVWRGQAL